MYPRDYRGLTAGRFSDEYHYVNNNFFLCPWSTLWKGRNEKNILFIASIRK